MLAHAVNDVIFIARGEHLKALQGSGLNLLSPDNDIHIKQVKATATPKEVGQVDLILFCVKLYDVEEATINLKPVIGPNTFVVTTRNDISGPEIIRKLIGRNRVLGGAAYVLLKLRGQGSFGHQMEQDQ